MQSKCLPLQAINEAKPQPNYSLNILDIIDTGKQIAVTVSVLFKSTRTCRNK